MNTFADRGFVVGDRTLAAIPTNEASKKRTLAAGS